MIRFSFRTLAAATAAAVVLAACGGGHGSGGVSPVVAQAPSFPGPSTFDWNRSLATQLQYVGPATAGGLSVAVSVHMQNASGLVRYAQDASNPASSSYRHWLTPAQIGAQYGATLADYQSVANYFRKYGLHVGGWPQREALAVSGTLPQFTAAFGTTFGRYTYLGKTIVAPNGTPKFASALPVDSVVGLVAATPRRYFLKNNNAQYFGYSPQQLATGFDFSGAYRAGFNGSGINVGIIGTGPILNAQGGDDDAAGLASYWHASLGAITQVAVSPQPASTANAGTGTNATDGNPSGLSTPPPVTAPSCTQGAYPNYQSCNPEDGEAQLDTESIASLAPGADVLFYLGFNPAEACINPSTMANDPPTGTTCPAGDNAVQAEGIQISDDEIQQAIADNRSDAISMSFGAPENDETGYIGTTASPGFGQIEIASLVAQGTAVFVSSGDDGAWECFDPTTGAPLGTACASYPASDANVVAVGGVNIPMDEAGNLTSIIAAWADNTSLGGNGAFQNNVGSGGGVSAQISAPAWQSATLHATMREIPDIALDADPNTGPSIAQNLAFSGFGQVYASGGTSAAAPEAAAQWALVLQACKASSTCNKGGATGYRLGNPDPLFYAIYAKSTYAAGTYAPAGFTPQLSYNQVFYDVLYGDNQAVPATPGPGTPAPMSTPTGYNSGPGYDEVTGLGAPFTGHLIQAIVGTSVP
jgi:kumamolisin